MTQSAVGTDFHEPLDIEGDVLAKISFDPVLLFDQLSDLVDLVIVQITNLCIETDCRLGQNLVDCVRPIP